MRRVWEELSSQGVGPGIDADRAKRVRLTNQVAITISLAMIPYSIIWYGLGLRLLAVLVIPLALIYASILLLNRAGHYRAGVVAYVTVFNLMTAVYAATLGSASLLRFVYFVNIAFPFLFSMEQERGLRWYGTLLPLALFGYFHLGYDDSLVDPALTDSARMVVATSLMPVVLLLLLAALAYMYREHALHEGELRFLAQHDPLTGLANRARFNTELEKAIARAGRGRSYLYGLLYLDLDKFKSINDTYGHLVGDRALQHVAEKARECLRTGDLFARVGGDELIALLDDIKAAEDAELVAEKILHAVGQHRRTHQSRDRRNGCRRGGEQCRSRDVRGEARLSLAGRGRRRGVGERAAQQLTRLLQPRDSTPR